MGGLPVAGNNRASPRTSCHGLLQAFADVNIKDNLVNKSGVTIDQVFNIETQL